MTVTAQEGPDGVQVLHVAGELDVLTAPPLSSDLSSLVGGATSIVLDLTAVSFLDSTGVRFVDEAAREAARRGAGFRVVAPVGTPSRRLLELLGMTAVLADEPD